MPEEKRRWSAIIPADVANLMITGLTHKQIAEKLGISVSAVSKLSTEKSFREFVAQKQKELSDRTTALLAQSIAVGGEHIYLSITKGKGTREEEFRLKAARTAMEMFLKFTERFEVNERLRALEEKYGAKSTPSAGENPGGDGSGREREKDAGEREEGEE